MGVLVSAFSPTIWSDTSRRSTRYVVAQQYSGQMIGSPLKLQIEEALGIRFEPVKGEGFIEWVKVPSAL